MELLDSKVVWGGLNKEVNRTEGLAGRAVKTLDGNRCMGEIGRSNWNSGVS